MLPKNVKVVEVGPRDGLQNEATIIATADKIKLIEHLASTGLKNIEATSFVSPEWIPQLADASQVVSGLHLPPDVALSALVPNLQGYEAARAAGINQIAVFLSATETHNRKNINKSTKEALDKIAKVVERAKTDNVAVRAYLSVVFVCPYEGVVEAEHVVSLIDTLFRMQVDEISLGDTIGAATPVQVELLLQKLTGKVELARLALHFHDTRGMALVNVMSGLRKGIAIFDSSIGGMGGCPYAPGASGNLATEDLVYLLDSLGIETGVELAKLVDCGRFVEQILGKPLPGRYLRSQLAK
jgi:hydroxymethylglutaryl-CoA lyase